MRVTLVVKEEKVEDMKSTITPWVASSCKEGVPPPNIGRRKRKRLPLTTPPSKLRRTIFFQTLTSIEWYIQVMPNLTDLVQVIPASDAVEPEDIFASAPGLIFTDDLRNQHGDPGSVIIYKSGRFGNIELRTADPEGEDERQLFSHYLWNAAIKLAELMSWAGTKRVDTRWSVQGEKVLELGAGWCCS